MPAARIIRIGSQMPFLCRILAAQSVVRRTLQLSAVPLLPAASSKARVISCQLPDSVSV